MSSEARVASIAVAPVKGLALASRGEVTVDRHGVTEDRRLHLIDARGRLVNGKRIGALVQIVPALDVVGSRLRLRFPDGAVVDGPIELGERVTTSFYGRDVRGRVVAGDFAPALSAFAGEPLRLVCPDAAGAGVDRGPRGAVTLLGVGSLERLAEAVGVTQVDPRRFRMLFEVDGLAPHEEDGWVGRDVAVGEAVVEVVGNVGRCVVTTRDPDRGAPDLETLGALATYRGVMETTEPLPFGVVGGVRSPGRVRVGDPVRVDAVG